jgi:hypothetical protein
MGEGVDERFGPPPLAMDVVGDEVPKRRHL